MTVYMPFNGLGCGNLGDELMALGLWSLWRPKAQDVVEIWPRAEIPQWYPQSCRYSFWRDGQVDNELLSKSSQVVLAGDTPVNEMLGLSWPLEALSHSLHLAQQKRIPVIAVGVGVDLLQSQKALKLFARNFLSIKAWSVRSRACRAALVKMGVERECIVLAADLAWLHRPQLRLNPARIELLQLGINPDLPFLAVNVVHEKWGNDHSFLKTVAAALDNWSRKSGWQIVFIANETRSGSYFDAAAAAVIADLMYEKSTVIAAHHQHPDQIISLLRLAGGVLAQRYHFAIEAVLAGQRPVVFQRGQKMAGLINELQLPCCGEMGAALDSDKLCRLLGNASYPSALLKQKFLVAGLRHRAARNITLLRNWLYN